MPALYTSLRAPTAVLEASKLGRPFQPLTLISYDVEGANLFDGSDGDALAELGFATRDLSYDLWMHDMKLGKTPPQHRLADALIERGFHGLRVQSFAEGAKPDDINVVFWDWSETGACLKVIDDEGRLPRDAASWS